MPSFDIVNEIDPQELDNAINNTLKEVATRYDFKGLQTEVSFDKKSKRISLLAAESMKMQALQDMLVKNVIKRGLEPKILNFGTEEGTSHGAVKMNVGLREGIDRETAKKIVKSIKSLGLKVQPAIMDEQVRVTGKKIDDLQEVMQHLRSTKFEVPLQFTNMK